MTAAISLDGGIVDAHHHLWDSSLVRYLWDGINGEAAFGRLEDIPRRYVPADFRADWAGLPVTQSVHVQGGTPADWEIAESQWLEKIHGEEGLPTVFVASCDLRSAELDKTLEQHERFSSFRGIRQCIGLHPNYDLAGEEDALLNDAKLFSGLESLAQKKLTFDLQVTVEKLERAASILRKIPELSAILVHSGLPWDQSSAALARWRSGLAAVAALPNTTIKLSGLSMFNPTWNRDQIAPIVSDILACFGAKRVMWGSNFPIDKLHRSYEDILTASWALVPPSDRADVFANTARRVYHIPVP